MCVLFQRWTASGSSPRTAGTQPMWRRDGRELFYRNGDKMMAVEIASGATFVAAKPRVLFEGRY